jgi:hypothetical protein
MTIDVSIMPAAWRASDTGPRVLIGDAIEVRLEAIAVDFRRSGEGFHHSCGSDQRAAP